MIRNILILFFAFLSLAPLNAQDGEFKVDIIKHVVDGQQYGIVEITATGTAGLFNLVIEGYNAEFNASSFWEVNGLDPGVYTATFTTPQGGCVFEREFEILTCPELIVNEELLRESIREPKECGSADGSIYFKTGYPFSNIDESAVRRLLNSEGEEVLQEFGKYRNLSNGTYMFTFDAGECFYMYEFTIGVDSYIEINFDYEQPCPGQNNGFLEVYVFSGQNDDHYFEWEDGSDDAIRENLPAGTYCVTAFLSNGCETTKCFDLVNIPTEFDISFETYYCPESRGEITAVVSSVGNVGHFEFDWGIGIGQGATISNLAGDTEYCVTVTNECNESREKCVFLERRELPPVSFSIDIQNSCLDPTQAAGELTASNIDGGAGGPYNVRWSNGQFGNSIDNLSSGEYCVTVSDNEGCMETSRCYTIEQAGYIFINVTSTQHCESGDCSNAEIIVTAVDIDNNQVEGVTFSWFSYNGSDYNSGSGNVIQDINWSGNYTITASYNGCEANNIVVEILNDCDKLPEEFQFPDYSNENNHLVYPASDLFPSGRIAVFPVRSGITYSWSGPSGSFITNLPYLPEALSEGPGNYTLVVDNGCEQSDFRFTIEECENQVDVTAGEICADCIEDGYGVVSISLIDAEPDVQYFATDGVTIWRIPMSLNEGGEFDIRNVTALTNTTIELIIFDEDFCGVRRTIDYTPNSYRIVELPFMNMAFNQIVPGTFTPFSCDIALICTNDIDPISTSGCGTGAQLVATIPGPPVNFSFSDSDEECGAMASCGAGGYADFTGEVISNTGYDGTYCYKGKGCLLEGNAYSNGFIAVLNAREGANPGDPNHINFGTSLPASAFYTESQERFFPDFSDPVIDREAGICTTSIKCAGIEVSTFETPFQQITRNRDHLSEAAYIEFHGVTSPENTLYFIFEGCEGGETTDIIPIIGDCPKCNKVLFNRIDIKEISYHKDIRLSLKSEYTVFGDVAKPGEKRTPKIISNLKTSYPNGEDIIDKLIDLQIVSNAPSKTRMAEARGMKEYIKIMPNPSNDVVTISTLDVSSNMQILAIDGRLVHFAEINTTSTKVDVSEYINGIYIVKVISALDGTVRTSKFIKQ